MIEHDEFINKQLRSGWENLYRWNDERRLVDFWDNDYEAWVPSSLHKTTVTVPLACLVNYEDTWTEPCEGITE